MARGMDRMPRQGDRAPWINPQDYARDKIMIRKGPIEDDALAFSGPTVPAALAPALQAAE
jgi:hypothetical protein